MAGRLLPRCGTICALGASVLYYRYYDMIIYYYMLEGGNKLYRKFEYFENAVGIANEAYRLAGTRSIWNENVASVY